MTTEEQRRETTVKITDFQVGRIGPHGAFTARLGFESEDGIEQLHVPDYSIDTRFIEGVLFACDAETVDEVVGSVVKAEYLPGEGVGGRAPQVRALKPLPFNSGIKFDLEYWVLWARDFHGGDGSDAALPTRSQITDADWRYLRDRE